MSGSKKAAKGSSRPKQRRVRPGASRTAVADRRKQFVEEYVSNGGNGTMAAIAVGFSEKTARTQASRLLTNVAIVEAIRKRRQELQRRHELTTDDVIQKLAQMVHFDVATLYDEHGQLKPVHLWPPEAAVAVQSIEAGQFGVMKVKTISRLDAVNTAMKHLGLFEKDNRQRTDAVAQLMAYVAKHNEPIPVTR